MGVQAASFRPSHPHGRLVVISITTSGLEMRR